MKSEKEIRERLHEMRDKDQDELGHTAMHAGFVNALEWVVGEHD